MTDKSSGFKSNQEDVTRAILEDLTNSEMYSFDMLDSKKIGEIHISIHKKKTDIQKEKHTYPDSFYIEDSNQLKPILEIDGFSTIGNSGGGYGRAGLQRAYEMSVEKGCEGRMEVHATWGAGAFYEHCGFMGKEKGKPGVKYFEPTSENIKKLYKGGKRENLTFKMAETMALDNVHDQTSNSENNRSKGQKSGLLSLRILKQR